MLTLSHGARKDAPSLSILISYLIHLFAGHLSLARVNMYSWDGSLCRAQSANTVSVYNRQMRQQTHRH